MYGVLSDRGRVMAVRLGSLTLLAIPGEPVAEVGRRWRAAAGEGSEVLSLAGDYLGYVETSDRMAKMAGETVHTYYGPELADRLTGTVQIAGRERVMGASNLAGSDPSPLLLPPPAAARGRVGERDRHASPLRPCRERRPEDLGQVCRESRSLRIASHRDPHGPRACGRSLRAGPVKARERASSASLRPSG
jgi:hypothetical protein